MTLFYFSRGGWIGTPQKMRRGFQAVNHHILTLTKEMDELRSIIATLSPATTPQPEPKPTRQAIKRNRKAEARIIDAVLETFDEQELIDLALELDINYHAILGNGLRGKVTGVIEHFARHGILAELVDFLVTERPHVDWLHMLIDTSDLK